MRWNKRFDGYIYSLKDKSHRTLYKHPNSHTDTEICWIKNLIRRNPNISLIELYAKLKLNKCLLDTLALFLNSLESLAF